MLERLAHQEPNNTGLTAVVPSVIILICIRIMLPNVVVTCLSSLCMNYYNKICLL